jgi:hypothetical protein
MIHVPGTVPSTPIFGAGKEKNPLGTHVMWNYDDNDMDVNLVGCDAGVTETDGRVSKEALKQNAKSEEWRADRAAHAHDASVFASLATSTVASAGTAAVTEALRVKQEIAIASHFVPQALALLFPLLEKDDIYGIALMLGYLGFDGFIDIGSAEFKVCIFCRLDTHAKLFHPKTSD